MERSDILLYENQLRFVELLLTGNREVTFIDAQNYLLAGVEQWLSLT